MNFLFDRPTRLVAPLLAAAAMAASAHATAAPAEAVFRSLSAEAPADLFAGERDAQVLLVQVMLDRARHSPGVIDGYRGGNTERAIRAFRRAAEMPVNSRIDERLVSALRERHGSDVLQRYTIAEQDVAGPFRNVPAGIAAKADLDKAAYESPAEALAEKFHMSKGLLEALNPGADFGAAGTEIITVRPGDAKLPAKVQRIEIDKASSSVRAYGSGGDLLATYPATIGSDSFPSPSGSMAVRAVAPAPTYHFDPSGRSWGPDRALTVAAGPNNPVGSTWIDLTKEGYGIHGTPEPRLIGKTSSHGCVRLTNWDAAMLGAAVSQGTEVVFVG